MQEQLTLFEDAARIRCIECGAELHDLEEFRQHRQAMGGDHLITSAEHGILYRRSAQKGIQATYALAV